MDGHPGQRTQLCGIPDGAHGAASAAAGGGGGDHRGGIPGEQAGQPVGLPPPGRKGALRQAAALCLPNRHQPGIRQGNAHLWPAPLAGGPVGENHGVEPGISAAAGAGLSMDSPGGPGAGAAAQQHCLCLPALADAKQGNERFGIPAVLHCRHGFHPVGHGANGAVCGAAPGKPRSFQPAGIPGVARTLLPGGRRACAGGSRRAL